MAKALIGYLSTSDPRASHLTMENARLRARVQELEMLVGTLKAENDQLVASHAELIDSTLQEMQPA